MDTRLLARRVRQLIERGQRLLERADAESQLPTYTAEVSSFIDKAVPSNSPYWTLFIDTNEEIHRVFVKQRISRYVQLLQSVEEEMHEGVLYADAESMIFGTVVGDLVSQAEELFRHGYFQAAAVLAGAAVEEKLRDLAQRHEIAIWRDDGRRRVNADSLNQSLAAAGVYHSATQQAVSSWLNTRNRAAHNETDKYSEEDVRRQIAGARDFLATGQSEA